MMRVSVIVPLVVIVGYAMLFGSRDHTHNNVGLKAAERKPFRTYTGDQQQQ